MGVDPSGRLMFCHGSDNAVELFSVCGAEEVKRRCQKRARKERRKVRAANSNEEAAAEDVTVPEPTIQVGNLLTTRMGKRACLRLRESYLLTPSGHGVGKFMQPFRAAL